MIPSTVANAAPLIPSNELRVSGNGVAPTRQACADRTPVRIGPRPPCGRACIDLLLRLPRLRLRIGVRRGPDDSARGAADNRSRACIAWAADDRADDRAADHAGYSARSRWIRGLNHHSFIGTRIRTARIH